MEQFRPAHIVDEDAALAVALAGGDIDAVRRLHVRHGRQVFTVASVVTRDASRAEQATVRTFLQAWRNADRFEPGRDFAPWLLALARRSTQAEMPEDMPAEVLEDMPADMPEGSAAPDDRPETVWLLRAGVDSLSADDREIARARYLERLDVATIAERRSLSADAVQARLDHVGRRLATRLAALADGDDRYGDPGAAAEGGESADRTVGEVLGLAAFWTEPSDRLADRVVAAVDAEVGDASAGLAHVHDAGRGERSWLRPALVGAVGAVTLLFVGVIVLSALSGGVATAPARTVTLTPTGLIADVAGEITITDTETGLRIELGAQLPRRDDGAFYQAWVETSDGAFVPAGTFQQGDQVTLWAGVGIETVDRFVITLERAAGAADADQTSSGDVVLRSDLR